MPDITSSMKEDKKGPKNREITLGLGYSQNTVSKLFFNGVGSPFLAGNLAINAKMISVAYDLIRMVLFPSLKNADDF